MRSSASIGVNLRVTGHCRQGGRKYMEDFFSVAYQQTEDEKDLEYAFFGIYDGHGGAEAAAFAKEHLMETIIKHKNFWSDYDEDVLRAIKDGYIATHYAMWKEQEKWPRTASGLPSTAGTTASIAFIRRGKIFIGHVGDSGIILGYQEPGSNEWKAKPLTRDHKPENADEMQRIKRCGGKVVSKSGVPRVVWNRPRIGHQGPVRRSTPIDEIPFLAVARSLGDLWSYNSQINQFIVSPDPDCSVMKIDTNVHRCLIFGTDGLYNMLSPGMAVQIVQQAERHNEYAALSDSSYKTWLNPSKLLVEKALERWHATKMRADNTSVVTLMLDPPGPPKAQVLKDRKKNLPERGLRIMTRFDDNNQQTQENNNCNTCDNVPNTAEFQENPQQSKLDSENVATPSGITSIPPLIRSPHIRQEESGKNPEKPSTKTVENDDDSDPAAPVTANTPVTSSDLNVSNFPLKERNFMPKLRESTSFDPREPVVPRNLVIGDNNNGKENKNSQTDVTEDNTIQCNEVSSSNLDIDNLCAENEEVESSGGVKQERHNLRSTKKVKSGDLKDGDEEENVKTSNKRKFKSEMSPIPRKSMRIDKINSSQKKSQETPTPPRRAFEAEEKLKKLAQQADLAKKLVSASPKENSNSKSEDTKKQSATDTSVAKKKIQLVLQKVKKVQKKGLLNPQKRKLLIVVKKQTNSTKAVNTVVATKVGFQRHLKKNHSQRVQPSTSKSVDGPTRSLKSGRIVSGNQNISKSEVAKIKTPKKLPEVEVGTSRSRSASATPRNSVPLNASAKPPKANTNPEKTNKTKTLGRRLQQKTEILRKTVMLKK